MTPLNHPCTQDISLRYTISINISLEQTFEIFLYHTKHVSKHLQAINDISIILNNFLITFQGRGKEGGKTTMENSTNFINILIKPYAKITRRYMFEITQNLFL